jgi:hypothetical protein
MSSIVTKDMAQGNTAIFVTAHDTAPTTSKKVNIKILLKFLTQACSSTSIITNEATKRKLKKFLISEEKVEVLEEEEEESDEYAC